MASRLSRFLNALWNRAGVVIVSNHIPCQITSIPIQAREADESRHVCNARETPCRAPRARSQQTPGEASKRDPIEPLFKPIILNDEARSEDERVSIWISNQARGPAEFKHIIKRRKRN